VRLEVGDRLVAVGRGAAGEEGGPLLPAAATMSSPFAQAVLQIVCKAAGAPPPPRLMLTMRQTPQAN
jgi:hypothetical protein